jgi:hypothetical protein
MGAEPVGGGHNDHTPHVHNHQIQNPTINVKESSRSFPCVPFMEFISSEIEGWSAVFSGSKPRFNNSP